LPTRAKALGVSIQRKEKQKKHGGQHACRRVCGQQESEISENTPHMTFFALLQEIPPLHPSYLLSLLFFSSDYFI
jgi:hypothetical protein